MKNEVCIWTEIICKRRDHLFNFFIKNNINCRKIWRPLSSFKHVQNNHKMSSSNLISNKVLWLPSSLDLTEKELKNLFTNKKNSIVQQYKMKIALVQSEEETKFIKSQLSGKLIFVPFNLESQTYLILNNLSFINPKNLYRLTFNRKL